MRSSIVLGVALAALSAWASAAVGAGRVPVAIVGDSIVESAHPGLPAGDGLLARLRAELERRGVDPGADGFVAAHPAEIDEVLVAPPARGPWRYRGSWAWLTRVAGAAAPIFSWTADPAARASVRAGAADAATLVYLAGPAQGRFRFRAGDALAEVDARRATPAVALRTLPLRERRATRVEVAGAAAGGLGLVGVFLRREPRPGRVQVELTAVAHGGAQAADPPTAAEAVGLAALRPRATVVMLGTNDGIGYARSRDPGALEALRLGIERRGRQARASGACLVVPPARAHLPAGVFARLRSAVRAGAREAGCAVAPLLDALDARPELTVDGVHPTSAGYRRLARELTPRVLALADVAAPRPARSR